MFMKIERRMKIARDECCVVLRWCQSDPPKNCLLTVKKLPKTWLLFLNCQNVSFLKLPLAIIWKKRHFLAIFLEKTSSFWQFFGSQMAIFWRVSCCPNVGLTRVYCIYKSSNCILLDILNLVNWIPIRFTKVYKLCDVAVWDINRDWLPK